MSEKIKMLTGQPYLASDPELTAETLRCQGLLADYNATPAGDGARRTSLLRQLLGDLGEGTVVRSLFSCDYGYNIRIGRNGFINYNCVFLDCAAIEIGDGLQMGPMVQLYTALHPLDPVERRSGLESARPIRLGRDVWIGGGAIVLPGVSIGDAVVVGAGSVVTRDLPPRVVAAGNPARILRRLPGGPPD